MVLCCVWCCRPNGRTNMTRLHIWLGVGSFFVLAHAIMNCVLLENIISSFRQVYELRVIFAILAVLEFGVAGLMAFLSTVYFSRHRVLLISGFTGLVAVELGIFLTYLIGSVTRGGEPPLVRLIAVLLLVLGFAGVPFFLAIRMADTEEVDEHGDRRTVVVEEDISVVEDEDVVAEEDVVEDERGSRSTESVKFKSMDSSNEQALVTKDFRDFRHEASGKEELEAQERAQKEYQGLPAVPKMTWSLPIRDPTLYNGLPSDDKEMIEKLGADAEEYYDDDMYEHEVDPQTILLSAIPDGLGSRLGDPTTSYCVPRVTSGRHKALLYLFRFCIGKFCRRQCQQVRWKRKGANRIGRPCWHHHGTNKVRGRMYYPFHKMIGKSANWHKYQERFVPPKAVEAKVRLVPTCYANYRAMRESKAWYWLLPKALAASTTGDEVLNSFLRFRHKQPKKIHHYLRCLARLLAVGGCDVADWRFKYIASRVKPLRFRIVNLPRLALMYAKLNAVKEVKDLTRFLHAKMEWYSMQQLSFVVRAFALVKLNDAFLFQTVVRRLQDSLEFHRAAGEIGGEGEAAGEAILGINVDGLLSPSGVGSGLLEKIRSRPNYKHQAYIGLSNVTYNKYHQGKHYRSPARQPNETVADYERRQRSLAIESRGSYAESRTYDAAGATKYKSSKPWGRQKRELPRLMSNSKELDLASDAGAAGGGGRPELGEAEAGPGGRAADLHGANGRSNARASAFRRGRSSSSGAATTTSTDFSSRVHPDTSLDCTEGTRSAFRSTTASGAPAPAQIKGTGNYNSQTRAQLPEDHDYLRPPTMEELICVAEGFAALEFKHYEFCGTVAQEFLLQPFFHGGDQHAQECGGSSEGSEQKDGMDPLVLLHASRLSLAFAKVGYRDYSFFAAVADLVVQRLASGSGSGARINTTSSSSSSFFIKLSPSMLVDILRAFRELGIHDPTLVHACSAELERRAYDYPARDMAFLSYVLSEMSGQVVGALSREYAALDLNAATAVAGAIAEIKSRRRMRAAGRSRAAAADEINRSDEVEAGELLDDHLIVPRRPGAAPTDGALDALLRKVSVLLTDNHRRESRERYEIGKMMEAMTLHLEPKEERQKLFHPFCRHLHRHLQFLEPVDFLRILSSLNRFECWDARVVTALGKWMQKRKGEFGKA
eukprot:g13356.t1